MKTEMTDTGWREITTKDIVVEHLGKNPFMPVYQWVDFNKRNPGIGRRRKTCNCCVKKWTDLTGHVHIAFTDNGNKAICDDCYNELSEKIKN